MNEDTYQTIIEDLKKQIEELKQERDYYRSTVKRSMDAINYLDKIIAEIKGMV